MKDLRLSEIKEICKSHQIGCEGCEFSSNKTGCQITNIFSPEKWKIETQPKDRVDTLEDTIDLMTSADYKDRFIAEYYQLKIRYEKLDAMVKNWDNLSFEPTCSKETFNTQLEIMLDYLKILEVRAEIEDIKLN